ncbi:hmu [Linum perenne]
MGSERPPPAPERQAKRPLPNNDSSSSKAKKARKGNKVLFRCKTNRLILLNSRIEKMAMGSDVKRNLFEAKFHGLLEVQVDIVDKDLVAMLIEAFDPNLRKFKVGAEWLSLEAADVTRVYGLPSSGFRASEQPTCSFWYDGNIEEVRPLLRGPDGKLSFRIRDREEVTASLTLKQVNLATAPSSFDLPEDRPTPSGERSPGPFDRNDEFVVMTDACTTIGQIERLRGVGFSQLVQGRALLSSLRDNIASQKAYCEKWEQRISYIDSVLRKDVPISGPPPRTSPTRRPHKGKSEKQPAAKGKKRVTDSESEEEEEYNEDEEEYYEDEENEEDDDHNAEVDEEDGEDTTEDDDNDNDDDEQNNAGVEVAQEDSDEDEEDPQDVPEDSAAGGNFKKPDGDNDKVSNQAEADDKTPVHSDDQVTPGGSPHDKDKVELLWEGPSTEPPPGFQTNKEYKSGSSSPESMDPTELDQIIQDATTPVLYDTPQPKMKYKIPNEYSYRRKSPNELTLEQMQLVDWVLHQDRPGNVVVCDFPEAGNKVHFLDMGTLRPRRDISTVIIEAFSHLFNRASITTDGRHIKRFCFPLQLTTFVREEVEAKRQNTPLVAERFAVLFQKALDPINVPYLRGIKWDEVDYLFFPVHGGEYSHFYVFVIDFKRKQKTVLNSIDCRREFDANP